LALAAARISKGGVAVAKGAALAKSVAVAVVMLTRSAEASAN
jgi:hypothetical protein